MKELEYSRRMYAGYPVFIITYYDKDNMRYNYTSSSSMYTLGKMATMGLSDNNALKCILENKKFTVSFLNSNFIDDIEHGGKSGLDLNKFEQASFNIEAKDDYQYIKEAELVYALSLVENFKSDEFPRYSNLICKIERVLAKDNLVNNNTLNVDDYEPLIFVGTDEGRFYRNLKK